MRRYLVSLKRKAVLLIHAHNRAGQTGQGKPRHRRSPFSAPVSAQWTNAQAIMEWRSAFGPDITELNVRSGFPVAAPWTDVRGGWKDGWQGWFLPGTTRASKHWRRWPSEGGELKLLGVIKEVE